MEDDKIKQLFKDFQPRLSSDFQFMSGLQRSMEAVEIVKQQNVKAQRRSRLAVVVAAISGFVAGIVLTILFPIINAWFSSITISLPRLGYPIVTVDSTIMGWTLIGAVCVTVAITTYDLTLSRLSLSPTK